MKIKSTLTDTDGIVVHVTYEDTDSFDSLLSKNVTQSYGICFCDSKLVIAYHKKKDHWTHIGGSIEKGETYEECLKREVREESNMKITSFKPIGYQEVQIDDKLIYQLRYACIVEPYGDFVSDPAGSVTEIKLIDPKDYKQYFDWLKIGDRIMERALEMLSKYNKKLC
ncbi:MAG: NUDIX domain-containing protein [Patescibacteria group bacterium]